MSSHSGSVSSSKSELEDSDGVENANGQRGILLMESGKDSNEYRQDPPGCGENVLRFGRGVDDARGGPSGTSSSSLVNSRDKSKQAE